MSAITRIRRGWHLGFQSLRVVFRDKTLLLFPLIPITCAVAVITSFYVIVGPDKILFALNTLRNERGVQIVNWGYYENVALAYAIVALISVYFSVGLVACTRITLDERDSKFTDGMKAALRNIHWVVIWAFIAWTIGPILNLLDHQRHTSRWVRKILKTSWSLLTYFVLPILVVDRTNIFSALRRSVRVMSNTWGPGAVSQLGLMWFFWLMNVPTLLLFGYGHYLEGPWPKPLTFVILVMVYATVVVYQTASSVLSVVLYKYATDGTVVEGFKGEWMKEAFVRPKVYVLVDDDPNDAYVPVEEPAEEDTTGSVESVPKPEGVEPVEDADQQDDIESTETPEEGEPETDGAKETKDA